MRWQPELQYYKARVLLTEAIFQPYLFSCKVKKCGLEDNRKDVRKGGRQATTNMKRQLQVGQARAPRVVDVYLDIHVSAFTLNWRSSVVSGYREDSRFLSGCKLRPTSDETYKGVCRDDVAFWRLGMCSFVLCHVSTRSLICWQVGA